MPPLKRFKNLDVDHQARVIGAAREMFEQQGYDSMSLNDLLRELEISKGQFYYWFEDKSDLFLAVLHDPVVGFRETFIAQGLPQSADDFWPFMQRLDDACGEWFTNNLHHIPIWSRVMELPRNHELAEGMEELFQPVERHFNEVLELGIGWGLVRDDIPLEKLMSLLHLIREGFDQFELENWSSLKEKQMYEVHLLRTKITRALLES